MMRLTITASGLAAAALILAACAVPQNTENLGQLSSETECMTASNSSDCKFEHLRAGGENIVLPQGSGSGKQSRSR